MAHEERLDAALTALILDELREMKRQSRRDHRELMEAIVASAANDPATVERIKAITARIKAIAPDTDTPIPT